ncbi:MAG: hypothetical protein M5U34_10270, partial [Chloroflexi bacterium]|nr:hypothetical protein [Chloroflexota bacterium]
SGAVQVCSGLVEAYATRLAASVWIGNHREGRVKGNGRWECLFSAILHHCRQTPYPLFNLPLRSSH